MLQRLSRVTAEGIAYSVRPGSVDALLVCTPGNGLCKECFDDCVDAIAGPWAVQIDLTGHGASRKPAKDWESANYLYRFGLDILAVMDAFFLEFKRPSWRVIGLAHSMGAKATLWAHVMRPAVFSSLVLVEPIVFPTLGVIRPLEERMKNPMSQIALKRRNQFASPEAVVAAFQGRSIFAKWTQNSLEKYARHGFRPAPGGGAVTLSCEREWEAINFASGDTDLGIWDKAKECVPPGSFLTIVMGEKSTNLDHIGNGMNTKLFYEFMAEEFKSELKIVSETTHSLPMEAPGIKALLEIVAKKLTGAGL